MTFKSERAYDKSTKLVEEGKKIEPLANKTGRVFQKLHNAHKKHHEHHKNRDGSIRHHEAAKTRADEVINVAEELEKMAKELLAYAEKLEKAAKETKTAHHEAAEHIRKEKKEVSKLKPL